MEETSNLRSRAIDCRVAHPETLLVTFLLDELQRARQRISALEALLEGGGALAATTPNHHRIAA